MKPPQQDRAEFPLPVESAALPEAEALLGTRILTRMRLNVAWLIGGRGFAMTVSIAYIAIAARALGPSGFGTFSLILAYGSSVAALAQCQSGQAVIRFGAIHLADRRSDRLGRLVGSLALLDWSTALLGALVAVAGVPLITSIFGWASPRQQDAALFSGLLLLTTGTTVPGLLRLLNRYDVLAYVEASGPSVRLIGAILASMHPSVRLYLLIWAAAATVECLAAWLALILLRQLRLSFGVSAIRSAIAENHPIGRFVIHNSFSNSLGLVWQYAGTFAVGVVGGTASAGGFRLAYRLATATTKPAEAVARVAFPEFARLVASEDRSTLSSLVSRLTSGAVLLGVATIGVVALGGRLIIRGLYGEHFLFAYPYLLLLVVAAAVDLPGIIFEPVLDAHGRSGTILLARTVGAIAYVLILATCLPLLGVDGAGVAAITSSIVSKGLMAVFVLQILRRAPMDSNSS